jgi:Icc-related predicted phosphoesterase
MCGYSLQKIERAVPRWTSSTVVAAQRTSSFSSISRSYWRVFGTVPANESRWYRLTERIDFRTGTWALWVDGKLHSQDLPLLEGATAVDRIRISNGGTRDDPALIDDIYVGDKKPAGIEEQPSFPKAERDLQFRFALFGDPQIGFGSPAPPHALDVTRFKAAIQQAESADCELILCVGDMVHDVTEAATTGYLDGVRTIKKAKWLPVPENHDPDDWYKKHVRKELDYTFEYKGITFIGMKTWTPDHQGGVTKTQIDWLKKELQTAAAKKHEIILWCHVTPFGPNPRGEWVRDGQKEMLAMCKKYRVLAVLAGHFHRELWRFEKDGTQHIVAPGITRTRGQLGWIVYDVYPDRIVQHFKPLWNRFEADGTSKANIVHGPLTFPRHFPSRSKTNLHRNRSSNRIEGHQSTHNDIMIGM